MQIAEHFSNANLRPKVFLEFWTFIILIMCLITNNLWITKILVYESIIQFLQSFEGKNLPHLIIHWSWLWPHVSVDI